ncbi:hypothetical protein HYV89_04710 [Candidatus Woesearchaeota archaeon]|nr:hypothetical protein [Candidatus Woesearchaeota archaeon]
MDKKIKLRLVWILLIIIFSSSMVVVPNALSYAGIDDAVVAGVGCITGAFLAGGSCRLYNPPKDSYDCEVCNKKIFGKCTEYQCRAIGRDCRFVPSLKDPKEGFCVAKGKPVYSSPDIISCGVIDIATMKPKIDVRQFKGSASSVSSGISTVGSGSDGLTPETFTGGAVTNIVYGCDLGELALNKQYVLILSTDRVAECRFSRTPNKRDLFEVDLFRDVYEDMPEEEAYGKILNNARNSGINLFTEAPNGLDHLWPIYFNNGQTPDQQWTPENIDQCNNGGCTWYARCADFDGNEMSRDYVFKFSLVDGVGDIDPPVILAFDPIDKFGEDKYTLPLGAKGELGVKFKVSDLTGVESCGYSDKIVGFEQMVSVNCRIPTENETTFNLGEQPFLKLCTVPLTGIKEGNNEFYFSCRDSSEKRNVNPVPYKYTIVGASKLSLQIKTPIDGSTIDGINDVLHVTTFGGIDGTALCKYNYAKVGGGVSGTNLVFASDTPGSENKKEHKQGINFLTENGEYILTINCADFNDPENTANGDLKIKFEKSQLVITKESPSDLIAERNPMLKVKTSGYDNGRAECRLYDKQSIAVFDDRSGVSMTSSGNLLHQFIFKDLTLGKHSSSVVCRSLDKNIQNSLEISFEIRENLPVACTSPTQCPSCSNDKYCATVIGSGKHLCDPNKVKQSCVNGFCSEVSCPTGDKFSTDYCEINPDPLCLSDKDKDRIADNLDCNDRLSNIGPCLIDQCKRCSEDESKIDNTGICVDIPNCTPKTPTRPPGTGTGQPTGQCKLTKAMWVDSTGRNQLSGNVNENTKVNVALQGQNCQGQSFNLELYELDDRGLLGKSFEKINTLDFPSQIVFGDQGAAFAEWGVKWLEDNGGINDDPEFVFRAANTNIESPVINVKKVLLPSGAKQGDSCKTNDNCDGKRDSSLACVKIDPNCPSQPVQSGDIRISIINPAPGKVFTSLPVEFGLDIKTGDQTLSKEECGYWFKFGRYQASDLPLGNVPDFNTLFKFQRIGRDTTYQSAIVNLYTVLGVSGPASVSSGDYGYYLKCKKGEKEGETIGYINLNLLTSQGIYHSECNTNRECVQVSGAGTNKCAIPENCQNVPTSPSHKICGANGRCINVVGAGTNTCDDDNQCTVTPPPALPKLTIRSISAENTDTLAPTLNVETIGGSRIEKDGRASCVYGTNVDEVRAGRGNSFSNVQPLLDYTKHSVNLGGLKAGDKITYFIKCTDTVNSNIFDIKQKEINIKIVAVDPNLPKLSISNFKAINTDTRNPMIILDTTGGVENGRATCKYSNKLETVQAAGGNSMIKSTRISSVNHGALLSDLIDGSHSYFVRCVDDKNDRIYSDAEIQFIVKIPIEKAQCSDGIDNDADGCLDLQDNDCQNAADNTESGSNCQAAPPIQLAPSTLRVVSKGPSGIQADTRVNLSVTLSGGPGKYGQDAECRFTNIANNNLLEGYDATLFPETLDFDPTNVVLGSTVYRNEINLDRIGDYTYYVKCKDNLGGITVLQTIPFKVEIPASQQISIVRKSPEGVYGSKNVAIAIETNGGLDNGASVNCNYQGIIGGGILTKQQIAGGRYAHLAIVPNVPNGNYTATVSCVDRANQIASTTLNIDVQEDLIVPVEQLIITKGSSKFITVSEAAECEASTDNVNWQKVGSDQNKRKHIVTLSGTYYFRCKDLWNNQMQTIIIHP